MTQNVPSLQEMVGGRLQVPVSHWGVEWAKQEYPQSWELATLACTVTHHQPKVKNLDEGLWVQYEQEERVHLLADEVKAILDKGSLCCMATSLPATQHVSVRHRDVPLLLSLTHKSCPQMGIILCRQLQHPSTS